MSSNRPLIVTSTGKVGSAVTMKDKAVLTAPEHEEEIHVAEVIRHGEIFNIPANMSIEQAIKTLERRLRYEEEDIGIGESIDTFPWDGAYAFAQALHRIFGWVSMEKTPTFFGPKPPEMMSIEVGPGKNVRAPWGRLSVPGIEGYLETGWTRNSSGQIIFRIQGTVKRKHEHLVQQIADLTREIVREESIYRSKAVRMKFKDDDGDKLRIPEVHFLDLSRVREDELIFSNELDAALRAHIFTPIERSEECRNLGLPLKRGVLLAGQYGTGKTLAAHVAAAKAQKNGWTFVYIDDATELPSAIRFAKQYEPAIIFAEDVDRAVHGERSQEMDEILNVIDGIESKDSELMIILTTNHVENIHQALLRPGRLDAVIPVTPPDNEASQRLVRLYGRGLVRESEDLTEVGKELAGNIPAVIRECVERAKLYALKDSETGADLVLTGSALLHAARGMADQLELLRPHVDDKRTDLEKLGAIMGSYIGAGVYRASKEGVDISGAARVAETKHKIA